MNTVKMETENLEFENDNLSDDQTALSLKNSEKLENQSDTSSTNNEGEEETEQLLAS